MPLGKRDANVPCEQRTKSPNRVPAQFGDSSLLLWWQSTHQAICYSCCHRLTIWWCSGKLHQPQRWLKRMQITPCEHLLPVAGIGEQHIDYSMLSDVPVLFSKRFVIGIVAITIRCPLFLWTLISWQPFCIVIIRFYIRKRYLYLYLCYTFPLMCYYRFYPYLVSYLYNRTHIFPLHSDFKSPIKEKKWKL